MKVLIKSNVALLCLMAALHSPHILADSKEMKLSQNSIFEERNDKDEKKWISKLDLDEDEFDFDEDEEFEDFDEVSPIPEANTYAMMLAGLGLVGFMVYRRRTP